MRQETAQKLRILKISLNEIIKCSQKSHEYPEDDIYYYHIFAFTQILFSIKEHLINLEKNINTKKFFENDIEKEHLSNLLKHYNISRKPPVEKGDLKHIVHLRGHIDPSMWEFLPASFSTYEYNNKNMVEICQKNYEDLINFLKKEILI